MNYYVKEKLLMKVLVLNGSPHKEGNTAALQATMTRFYAIVAEGDKF